MEAVTTESQEYSHCLTQELWAKTSMSTETNTKTEIEISQVNTLRAQFDYSATKRIVIEISIT